MDWKNKKVQTFRSLITATKPIPSGWRGEVVSTFTPPNGRLMLVVVWELTGEEIAVYEDEIEEAH